LRIEIRDVLDGFTSHCFLRSQEDWFSPPQKEKRVESVGKLTEFELGSWLVRE
jgi:hypothetical protein